MKVTFFFRKKTPAFNSIEELFGAITTRLSAHIESAIVSMPSERADVRGLIKNLRWAYTSRGQINHITGHVNYIGLVTGPKTLLTIHDVQSSFNGNGLHRFFMKLVWYWLPALFVKRISVISEFSKKELIKIIPFAKHKIHVVYNPVKKELQYTPKVFNSKKPVILHIGTKPNKNLENTIKALEKLSCTLHIIGKLSQDQIVLLEKCNIDYKNECFIPYHQIIKAYEDCDLLSFASTYEGFGMPIIEAQAIGRPVLTSNIGAMQEVAHNSACSVNPFNVEAIRNGIQHIIENEAYRDDLIQKGLKNTERFQLEKITSSYLALYKALAI
jgi:glycosyltransferase involved in cell wall biosynthesis